MKFIDKLERKFGRFGVPNLTVYIIGCYVLGYFLAMFAPGVLNMLSLDMSMVMKGQIWSPKNTRKKRSIEKPPLFFRYVKYWRR